MNENGFQVLSLDGGGIRGAYAAAFIAQTERLLGHSITTHFDLLAGTSTGGIIATALAFGLPGEKIESLYREHGRGIFLRERKASVPLLISLLAVILKSKYPELASDPGALFEAKYTPAPLRKQLEALFGGRTLEEASTRLILPSVDLVRGQTVVFKTPHLPGLVRDRRMRAVDVVLATAAAPTYFPPHEPHAGVAYCDGGLWANNPTIVAYAEAVKISKLCARPHLDPDFSSDEVRVLSVGTGHDAFSLMSPGQRAGIMYWGAEILDVMGTSQSQGADFQARYLLDDRYTRVDFRVPDPSWKLDRVEPLDQLLHLGREAATTEWKRIQTFFTHSALPYCAFPDASGSTTGNR